MPLHGCGIQRGVKLWNFCIAQIPRKSYFLRLKQNDLVAILSSFPPPSLAPPPLSVRRKGEKEENRLPPLLLPSKDRKPSFASHGGEKRERIRKLLCKYGRKGGEGGKEGRACRFAQKGKIHPFFFWGGMERFSSSRNKMPPSYLLHKTLTVGAEEEKNKSAATE